MKIYMDGNSGNIHGNIQAWKYTIHGNIHAWLYRMKIYMEFNLAPG